MGRKIVYYHGCFVNYFDHETGLAVIKVLEKNGFEVEVTEFICCSFPLYYSGDMIDAQKRAAKLIDALSVFAARGCDIVYSCPTCGYALKKVYPVIIESEAARLIASKTRFISAYLLELYDMKKLNIELRRMPLRVAYHVPCHLKSQNLSVASATLLALIPGVEVQNIDRGCCGMGGTWGLRSKNQGHLSGQVGAHLFEAIKEGNPQLVATDCAGCQIQIARYTGYVGNEILHPIRILAEAYL